MKNLHLIGWSLFIAGLIMNIFHLPFTSLVKISGPTVLLYHAVVFGMRNLRSDPEKTLFYLLSAFTAVNVLFRVMFWPEPLMPITYLSLLTTLVLASSVAYFILFFVKRKTIALRTLLALVLTAGAITLPFVDAHHLFAALNMNSFARTEALETDYQTWDYYSFHLSRARKTEEALEANQKAMDAVVLTLKNGFDEKATEYLGKIELHRCYLLNAAQKRDSAEVNPHTLPIFDRDAKNE